MGCDVNNQHWREKRGKAICVDYNKSLVRGEGVETSFDWIEGLVGFSALSFDLFAKPQQTVSASLKMSRSLHPNVKYGRWRAY